MDPTTVVTAGGEVVKHAAAESGWMAAVLCLVGFIGCGALIWLVRWCLTRMTAVVDDNTMAFLHWTSVLKQKGCMRDSDADTIRPPEDDTGPLGEIGKRVVARRQARTAKGT
jgi:hypothetical protein